MRRRLYRPALLFVAGFAIVVLLGLLGLGYVPWSGAVLWGSLFALTGERIRWGRRRRQARE